MTSTISRRSRPGSVPLAAGALLALAAPLYRLIVGRLAREQFARLSRGETAAMVAGMTPDVHHYFPGDHALAGERTSRAAVERWFARLTTLIPGIRFDVRRVAVAGWPWDTVAAVEWTSHALLPDGTPYDNRGTHVIRLRWGRATAFSAYLDSQRTAAALDRLAALGVAEASAAPIVG